MDSMVWWDVLDSSGGWKLEKNKVTGHCRIIDLVGFARRGAARPKCARRSKR